MITPKQLDEKVTAKYVKLQMKAAEEQIDKELEDKWEMHETKAITVWFDPPVHRSILDEIQRRYSGPNKWAVSLRSKDNNLQYNGVELKRFMPPYTGGGRD